MSPTSRDYVRALSDLSERGLHPKKLEMLRAHYAAPGRTATMATLAHHVGYPNHSSANLHYGGLAKALADAGEFPLPERDFGLSAIATWEYSPRDYSGHFAFTMRPALAAALEELGLARGARAPRESQRPEDYLEGELRKRFLTERTREKRARHDKIQDHLRQGLPLRCAVPGCAFDFGATYGERGRGFIEVHHLRPLAAFSGVRRVKLSELALVCPNCHAMIHRYGDTLALSDLKPRRAR